MVGQKLQLLDSGNDNIIKPIYESTIDKNTNKEHKYMYFEDKMLMYDIKNKNNRIYPKDLMRDVVDVYYKEKINTNRSLAEISHPTDRISIDLVQASHMITELRDMGNGYYWGKAKVLTTPMGKLLESLLNDGVQFGVSSRNLGSSKHENGVEIITECVMECIDAVYDPSIGEPVAQAITESRLNSLGIITDTQSKYLKESLDDIVSRTNIISLRKIDLVNLLGEIINMTKSNMKQSK